MNTTERTQMLARFRQADVWLSRVYDLRRTDEHRLALWNFLMSAADDRLKHIIINTHEIDDLFMKVGLHGQN